MVLVRNYRIGRNRDMGAADLGRTTHLAMREAAAQLVEGDAWSARELRTGEDSATSQLSPVEHLAGVSGCFGS